MRTREKREPEVEVLRNAFQAFSRATGLVVEILPEIYEKGLYQDAEVRVALPGDKDAWYFVAEVKTTLTRGTLGVAMRQMELFPSRQLAKNALFVTRYVTPQMADELREKGVQFVDTAGNAYINNPPLYVFAKGNKPIEGVNKEAIRRAFRPAGLRVIFALLCMPGLEDRPFRKIAEIANVALGTVGWVMRDLRQMGYLVDMGGRGRRLVRKKDLIDRWVAAYPDLLRPKQVFGRFRAIEPDWWKRLDDIRIFQAYWGGETAAALLTRFLKPEVATIYVMGRPNELIIRNKMKKDPHGDIEILKVFWHLGVDQENDGMLVPPLLIYADLLATGDPRNIETAKQIYEQELDGLIRED